MTTYPGGKAADGVYQAIISQFPPHDIYVEPFLGGGAILRQKRPANQSFALDLDDQVAGRWQRNPFNIPNLTFVHANAMDWLEAASSWLNEWSLVYLDPPYLVETRRSQSRIYRHEMTTDDHIRLLEIITSLRCMVAISGYWSMLYNDALHDWRAITYQTRTRSGEMATEYLWMNYSEPVELHDYRYLGHDYHDRDRIKRKKARWVERLKTMPTTERYAILAAIEEYQRSIPPHRHK